MGADRAPGPVSRASAVEHGFWIPLALRPRVNIDLRCSSPAHQRIQRGVGVGEAEATPSSAPVKNETFRDIEVEVLNFDKGNWFKIVLQKE